MSFRSRLKARFGGFAIYGIIRNWMSFLDYQAIFYDPTVDPASASFCGPIILIFWHEYIPLPVYLRPYSNVAMLVSRHRDAEWLSEATSLMGFHTVRGSTKRGGDAAMRALFRKSRTMNLAITPDGPRGPRRRLASGCIFVASKLQIPLIPVGLGYDRPWRLRTWDRFAVPRPYSRARLIIGPRMMIPERMDREAIESHRQHVEQVLNQLTDDAEAWALSGERRPGQTAMISQSSPRRRWIFRQPQQTQAR